MPPITCTSEMKDASAMTPYAGYRNTTGSQEIDLLADIPLSLLCFLAYGKILNLNVLTR